VAFLSFLLKAVSNYHKVILVKEAENAVNVVAT
jgi:hypothetical protein